MKAKKKLLFVLAVAAAMMAGPIKAAADEAGQKPVIYGKEVTQETPAADELPENDELFEGYVEELFFGKRMATAYGSYAKSRLEGPALQLYQHLKEKVEKVAAGELAETQFSFTLSDIGITKESWTAEDLGVDTVVEGDRISPAAVEAWRRQNIPGLNQVLGYLLADCPLDLYWYDKTAGTAIGPEFTATGWGDGWELRVSGIIGYFPVADEYQDASAQNPGYTVDRSVALSAQAAAERAKDIVKKYEGFSDHDKLEGYRKEICALTSYNDDAAEDASVPYGNPWQVIWVFDGDDTTNVVCEGYAKAFQYLCDLSDFFSPNIKCYTISGDMDGGTGAGAHMWNIVTMDDRKNYLVDITNCDEQTIGADDLLFLAGASGSVSGGYAVNISGHPVTYRYASGGSADMSEMYGDILEISSDKYVFPYKYSGGFGADLEWTMDANGFLNIKGSGDMPNPKNPVDYEAIPWYDYRGEIRRVVVEEGITSVADWAFLQVSNITEIYLPNGLKSIGNASFALSGIKKLALPATLESIGMLAFANCTDLAELEIPDSAKAIGVGAFMDCSSLDSVAISEENPNFTFEDGILYDKEKTKVQMCLGGKEGEVTISDGVKTIEMYAFNGCGSITDVVIPASVTEIGAEAFKECMALKNVWFLGECPAFQAGSQDQGSVFGGSNLTVHYPRVYESSWADTVAEGFADAAVTFEKSCLENDHKWQADYTTDREATCTEDGLKSIRCELCGRVKEWGIIPAAHSWEEGYTVEKAATCTEEGLESIHCKNCEEIKDSRPVPLAAHQLTKAKKGTVEYYICSVCKKTFRDAAGTEEFSVSDIKDDQPVQKDVKVTRISITSDASNKIAAGKKVSLKAAVFPENASNPAVKWESGNTRYATVNQNGVVTTKKAGKGKNVTITASAADGSGIKASFKIKLMGNAVTKIKITNAKKTLKAGKTMKLKVLVDANGGKVNKKVQWTSSNTDYATVDSKGRVKAKKNAKGKAVTITAMAMDGSKKKHKVKIKIV